MNMNLKVKNPSTDHPNSGWEDNSACFRKHGRPTKRTDSKDSTTPFIIIYLIVFV